MLSGQGRLGAPAVRAGVSAGLLAVDLFFVLTAFVLFLPVVRPGAFPPLGDYVLRRAARILPIATRAKCGPGDCASGESLSWSNGP